MAKKITQLSIANTVSPSDTIIIVQNGETKQVPVSTAITASLGFEDLADTSISPSASAGQFLKFDGSKFVVANLTGSGDMLGSNNLSDLTDTSVALFNLGIDSIDTRVDSLSAANTSINSVIESTQADVSTNQVSISFLKSARTSTATVIASLAADVSSNYTDLDEAITSLQAQYTSLSSFVASLGVEDLTAVSVSVGAGVDGYALTYDNAKDKYVLRAAAVDLTALQDSVDANTSTISVNEANISTLEGARTSISSRVGTVSAGLTSTDNRVDTLGSSLVSLEGTVSVNILGISSVDSRVTSVEGIVPTSLNSFSEVSIERTVGNNGLFAKYDHGQGKIVLATVASGVSGSTQDLFQTIIGDTGSITAASPTDTLTFRGVGLGDADVRTLVSGDYLDIIVSVNSTGTDYSGNISSVDSRVTSVEGRVANVSAILTSAKTSINSRLNLVSAGSTSVNARVTSVEGRISTVSAGLTSVNSRITSISNLEEFLSGLIASPVASQRYPIAGPLPYNVNLSDLTLYAENGRGDYIIARSSGNAFTAALTTIQGGVLTTSGVNVSALGVGVSAGQNLTLVFTSVNASGENFFFNLSYTR
jgi:hypothetical protein